MRIVRNYQVPGPFTPEAQGYCDFHNGVYFPSLAFWEQQSPYGATYAKRYPVERPVPMYSPIAFLVHSPWVLIPLPLAERLYFAYSCALVLLLAGLATCWSTKQWNWATFWLLGSALVYCRGGQQTLFTGYFTLELVLGSLIAVQHADRRPLLSGLGLALISIKPTYVLPIAGLMLFRGNWRAVLVGVVLSILGAAIAAGWLLEASSLSELSDDIKASQDVHRNDAYELPSNTWTRIDLLAIVSKWQQSTPKEFMHLLVMVALLIPAAIVLRKHHRDGNQADGVSSFSGALIFTTALVSVYHQVYDAIVLLPAFAAVLFLGQPDWTAIPKSTRWILAGCWAIPGLNYFSSLKVIQTLHIEGMTRQIVTSVNGICLAIAMIVLLIVARRVQHPAHTAEARID